MQVYRTIVKEVLVEKNIYRENVTQTPVVQSQFSN